MFNKVEFSDLYKFLTSIGLIFIASAFLFPWLFMKNELGIELSTEDYNSLIEKSKELADRRIDLNLTIVKLIPWISSSLLVLGLIMVFFGLKNWKKKQDVVDETENLNLFELRTKIQSLKPAEVKHKAETEIEEEFTSEMNSKSKEEIVSRDPQKNTSLRDSLLEMENRIFQKIIDYNTFQYKPMSNVKINDGNELDILLQAYNNRKKADVIIEIKYIQQFLNMGFIRETYQKVVELYGHYTRETKRKTKVILLIVIKEDIASTEEIDRFADAIDEYRDDISNIVELYPILDKDVDEIEVTSFFD